MRKVVKNAILVDSVSAKLKLIILGGGRMGKAFIKGLSHSAEHQISVVEPISELKTEIRNNFNVNVSNFDNAEKQIVEMVPLSDYVLLCVKPQTFHSIKGALKNSLSNNQIIISIMAGIKTETICNSLETQNVVRVMPNTPSQIGKGISVWFRNNDLTNNLKNDIEGILGALGEFEEIFSEEIIDKVTAISGSGPGYIFYFMESMLKSCQEIGLDKNLSRRLIIKTFLGSSELASISKKDFNELKEEVASPKGTTEAGLNKMIENNFYKSINEGIRSAYLRAKELDYD